MTSNNNADPGATKAKFILPFNDGPVVASEYIRVLVGQAENLFMAPNQLLVSSSDFFKNALKDEWEEGSEHTIKLLDADTETFTIYSKWLYTGRMYSSKETDDTTTGSWLWGRLAECYQLGDFLQDLDFKDAVIDAFTENMVNTGRDPLQLGQFIYPYSREDSLHRKYARDIAISIWNRDSNSYEKLRNPLTPMEYLLDMLVALSPELSKGVPTMSIEEFFAEKDPCHYHDHTTSGRPCYKTRFHL